MRIGVAPIQNPRRSWRSQEEDKAEQQGCWILQNDPNNSKFNFLKNPSDPYRAYYNQRLLEERGSNAKQPSDVEIA